MGAVLDTGPASTSLNRQVLSLALPALGALIAEPLFVLADSAMVGHLGAVSLAGLSLASTILTTTVGLFVFLAYATTATTARLFGAGRRTQGLRAGVDGMWLALLLGLGAGAFLGVGAPWLTEVMGAHGPVAQAAVAYLRASCPGLPGMFVVLAATGVLRGLLDTRTPFVVATAGAVLNVVVNAILLYGVGMGIAGSGAGTAIAQTVMALALARPIVHEARAADVGLLPHREVCGPRWAAGHRCSSGPEPQGGDPGDRVGGDGARGCVAGRASGGQRPVDLRSLRPGRAGRGGAGAHWHCPGAGAESRGCLGHDRRRDRHRGGRSDRLSHGGLVH